MKKALSFILLAFIVLSCNNDDSKSSQAEITEIISIDPTNQDLNLVKYTVDQEKSGVHLFLDNDLRDFSFPISFTVNYKLSKGATTSSLLNNELVFANSDDVNTLEIKAEDGSIKEWYVYLVHKQIQNSDFDDWYSNKGMDGNFYDEIGLSMEKAIWSTANLGTSLYRVFGTAPIIEGPETFVQIITIEPSLSVPLAAGTLFTGKFDVTKAISNPLDPKKATLMGTPFISKPTAFRVNYKYTASTPYIQVTYNNSGNIFDGYTTENLEGEDQCAIYAILESREGDNITEIARAELNSVTTTDFTEQYIDFNYTSTSSPTHITVVFTSSKDGDLWKGSVGSTLIIKEFELIYE
jgi:hypothetical protein